MDSRGKPPAEHHKKRGPDLQPSTIRKSSNQGVCATSETHFLGGKTTNVPATDMHIDPWLAAVPRHLN